MKAIQRRGSKPRMCYSEKHKGRGSELPDHSSPYPVSRLAPAFEPVDLSREISEADRLLNTRVSAKLQIIADQISYLQQEARSILTEARRDQELNHARCSFQRKPGNIYHLYRRNNGATYFSLLSPDDWRNRPPHDFIGSYRLENDMGWTPV